MKKRSIKKVDYMSINKYDTLILWCIKPQGLNPTEISIGGTENPRTKKNKRNIIMLDATPI